MGLLIRRLQQVLKNKTLRDTFMYMSGNLFSQGIAFVVLPIFTHYLSPEDFGIYNYTNSIKSVLAVLTTLSLNSFVLRYYFKLKTQEEKDQLISTTFLFLLAFSGLLLAAEYAVIPLLINLFSIKIPFHPYFNITIINIFLETTFVIPMVLLRVRRKALTFVALSLAQALLAIALGFIFVISYKWALIGRYYGILIANVLFAVIYAIFTFRYFPVTMNLDFLKKGMRFSAPLLPAAFAAMVIACLDRVWLERYASLSELGIYTTAFTLGTSLLIIARAFYMAVEPEIFTLFERREFDRIVMLKNRFIVTISLIGAIIIIFSREAVELLLSPPFRETYKIIPFFVAVSVIRGSRNLITTVFHAYNKTNYEFYIMCIGLVVGVLANMVLIPRYGVYGAATASIITYGGISIASFYFMRKLGEMRWQIVYEALIMTVITAGAVIIMQIDLASVVTNVSIKLGSMALALFLLYRVNQRASSALVGPAPTASI